LVDAAARQGWEDFFVLPPLGPKRGFPFDIRGNSVAVADMNRPGSGDAFDGAVERFDPPAGGIVHVDVEGRLVELSTPSAARPSASWLRSAANAIAMVARLP
jgi:hypothetical protein